MVAPVVVLLMMFGLRTSPVISGLSGLLVAAGGPVLLASFVRHQGLREQTDLLSSWGAWPSAKMLATGTPAVLQARRAAVTKATGMALPAEGDSSDDGYEVAVAQMRARTRDANRFPLVFAENCNFGRERNLLGLRRFALPGSVVCLLVGVAASVPVALSRHSFSPDLWLGLALLAGLVGFWLLYPSRDHTLLVAEKYAERLIEAAGLLP
jgi:hypothetical protein